MRVATTDNALCAIDKRPESGGEKMQFDIKSHVGRFRSRVSVITSMVFFFVDLTLYVLRRRSLSRIPNFHQIGNDDIFTRVKGISLNPRAMAQVSAKIDPAYYSSRARCTVCRRVFRRKTNEQTYDGGDIRFYAVWTTRRN